MTTATKLTPAQFREELQSLLTLAAEYAALESRIESKAMELEESDWQFADDAPSYLAAVEAQVRRAFDAAKRESGSELDALDLCQHVQDALDVLTFAIERSDDAR